MEACFQVINKLPLFENFISLLENAATWPKIIGDFHEAAITKIVSVKIVLNNNC